MKMGTIRIIALGTMTGLWMLALAGSAMAAEAKGMVAPVAPPAQEQSSVQPQTPTTVTPPESGEQVAPEPTYKRPLYYKPSLAPPHRKIHRLA